MENSPSYKATSTDATVFAWVHSHVGGNKCFLSSVDLHNQLVYEKLFPHILAIVVEIGQTEVNNVEYYQLSNLGIAQINHCNDTINNPLILHESCANDEKLFTRLTNRIQSFHEQNCHIIDARDDQRSIQSNFGEYCFLSR